MRADNIRVEGIEFSGARVSDRNGAGIRHEKGRLTVDRCRFLDNENGIRPATTAKPSSPSPTASSGATARGTAAATTFYVGTMKALTVSESYFHHAKSGHLLKSRAARSTITYNRLADGPGGEVSYELEFRWWCGRRCR